MLKCSLGGTQAEGQSFIQSDVKVNCVKYKVVMDRSSPRTPGPERVWTARQKDTQALTVRPESNGNWPDNATKIPLPCRKGALSETREREVKFNLALILTRPENVLNPA